jgi:small subunit ribosomal protein S2
MLGKAAIYIKQIGAEGGKILFVGTKKQAQSIVEEEAKRAGMFYVNQRWIGGTLTNFAAIQSRIDYLVRLEDQQAKGEFVHLPKKEAAKLTEEITAMNIALGGIKEMTSLPDALFIVTPARRHRHCRSAEVGIPIIAKVVSNCNPDEKDAPSPTTTTPSAPSCSCQQDGSRHHRSQGAQPWWRRWL